MFNIQIHMEEIWKPVEGYESYYEVSNIGRIRSFDRVKNNRWGSTTIIKGKILSPTLLDTGYYRVVLYGEGGYQRKFVHRLVAEAFIPNPNNLPCINHKDEVKTNNFVFVNPDKTVDYEKSNLEWCTYKYNIEYSNILEKSNEKLRTPVCQIKNGTIIDIYLSQLEAARVTHLCQSNINKCLKGKISQTGGYQWKYLSN